MSSMLIRGASPPPQSVSTQKKSIVWGMIDEASWRRVYGGEKESIGEWAKAVVKILRLALDPLPLSSTTASESLSGFLSPRFSLSASFAKGPSPSPTPLKSTPPSKTKPVIPEDESTKATPIWETRTGDPEHHRRSCVCAFQ